MEEYEQEVGHFLFKIGSSYRGSKNFQVVWENHYTGIPSNKPNMFLLIAKTEGEVLRVLANIVHSRETGIDKNGEVWLTGQVTHDEKTRYGKHLPLHGIYRIGDTQKVIDKLHFIL